MTEEEKNSIVQEVLNRIQSNSQSVDELETVASLGGVVSLPAQHGYRLVRVPVSLLSKPAEDAAKTANDAAGRAAESASKADVATGKATDAAGKASDAALGAERVDAVLGDDNVLTITDRNGNKKSLTLQSVAEALEVAKLVMQHDAELAALPLDNLGDATAENMDFLNYPTLCGCPTIVICEEAPSRAPDFVGQFWIDKKSKKCYMAFGVSNAGDFNALN